jgi:hypothetical protein
MQHEMLISIPMAFFISQKFPIISIWLSCPVEQKLSIPNFVPRLERVMLIFAFPHGHNVSTIT